MFIELNDTGGSQDDFSKWEIRAQLGIPTIPPGYSEGKRPLIPTDSATLFRFESGPLFRANRSVATRVLQLLLVFVVGLPLGCQVVFLFRMDSPLSVMVWALWISLSRMASASVGSPMHSCQCSMGIWAAMSVEPRS